MGRAAGEGGGWGVPGGAARDLRLRSAVRHSTQTRALWVVPLVSGLTEHSPSHSQSIHDGPYADAKPLQKSKPEPDIRHQDQPAPLDSSKAGPGMVSESWSGAGGEGNFLPVRARTLVSCLRQSSVHSASVSERGPWSQRGGCVWLCILSRKVALAESVRGGE